MSLDVRTMGLKSLEGTDRIATGLSQWQLKIIIRKGFSPREFLQNVVRNVVRSQQSQPRKPNTDENFPFIFPPHDRSYCVWPINHSGKSSGR